MKVTEIKQPECLDENGHLILKPLIDIARSRLIVRLSDSGQKRIGKTFGVYALDKYYTNHEPAFYVRRYDKTFHRKYMRRFSRRRP